MALSLLYTLLLGTTAAAEPYTEPYRSQYHFTPRKNWMNDPNGLLFHNNIYHLFYQYNPNGTDWGAMSWGHATSTDLHHWEEQPIALLARGYPDTITEMYFSGSAIADVHNTSGFGTDESPVPLVAVYTSFYPKTQTLPSGQNVQANQQAQSIAYSLDNGTTWTPWDAGNPVIPTPPAPYSTQDTQEFRDPFVFFHEPTNKWIAAVSLATQHKIAIYTSDNLKTWTQTSTFGPFNAVAGVWECPNLFPLQLDDDPAQIKWVAQISVNPGGPPGTVGSGTQYVVGMFDGERFVPDEGGIYTSNNTEGNATQVEANWVDNGPDFYAPTSFNGLPSGERIDVAWMSNWQYAAKTPEKGWRGAFTLPRRLGLRTVNGRVRLVQEPVVDLAQLGIARSEAAAGSVDIYNQTWTTLPQGTTTLPVSGKTLEVSLQFSARNKTAARVGITALATPDRSQQTQIGYDFEAQEVFLDRTQSGDGSFDATFASVYHAPLTPDCNGTVSLRVFLDWSSVEVLGGSFGETSLTARVFPSKDAKGLFLFAEGGDVRDVGVIVRRIGSVWR
ncbi:glycoside hydrolase family 32 protein [Aspergillus homomorphus CBS 101889]|uniref:Putative inulinase n=1 Tax=Aspergillus homomorphus (strain CBS 101889) TaxID=1450537 RepID=A0A395I2S5_ASPHC|nr:putative inulinase precursor [Aspergillus homomorphus CBS 101889]RAL14360.1 putative inulinase precursor [Aspergillus homomorphus CBS 101889]